MIELEQRLRRQLDDAGARLPLSPAGATAVMARGRSRRRRRRVAVAATLAVATLAGAVTTATILDREQGVDVAAGSPAVTQGVASLSWQRVDPVSTLSYATALVTTDDGVLYALSTAPGETAPDEPPRAALYRSADGLDWTPTVLDGRMSIRDIAAVDGRLYAVGTAAATAAIDPALGVGDVVVAWSDDESTTWEQAVVPLDLRRLRAQGLAAVRSASIASTPFGILIGVSVEAYPELQGRLPVGTDTSHGWRTTPTGVEVYAPPVEGCPQGEEPAPTTSPERGDAASSGVAGRDCIGDPSRVAASFTWAELGIEPAVADVYGQPARLFLARDGVDFQPVELPQTPEVRLDEVQLLATPDGAVVAATSWEGIKAGEPGSAMVFRSADGSTWTSNPVPGLHVVLGGGVLGGQLGLYGYAPDGSALLATSPDGVSWGTRALQDLVDTGDQPSHGWLEAADIGPLGFVGSIGMRADAIAAAGGVAVETGGYTLRILDEMGRATVTDRSGTVVAELENMWAGSEGRDVTVADPITNQPLVTFEMEAIEQAMSAAWDAPSDQATYLVHSTDGTAWSVLPADQLVGEPVASLANISVGADSVQVTALLRRSAGETELARTVLVGTAPG